jgi:hypothetical protein
MFVRESEAAHYRARGFEVVIQPEGATGNMARVRNAILDHAKAEKADAVIMLDDDVTGVSIWTGRTKHQRALASAEIQEFGERLAVYARDAEAPVFGINLVADRGAYRTFKPFSLTKVVLGTFMGVLLPTDLRFDPALPLKEDYDFCLQALNRHRRILRADYACYHTVHVTIPGGCAIVRTAGVEASQYAALLAKWGPTIVRSGQASRDAAAKGRGLTRTSSDDHNPIVRVPIPGV